MFDNLPLLSLVIWLPIIGGIVVLFASRGEIGLQRLLALAFSVATFLISIPLYSGFDVNTPQMQFTELAAWIPSFNVNYSLGVDGFSMPLILLTTFFTVIVVISGWEVIKNTLLNTWLLS